MDIPAGSSQPLSASRSLGASRAAKSKESKTDNLIASLEALNKAGVLSDHDLQTKKQEILASKSQAKAKKVFEAFDTDKSGTIDRKELQVLVFEMGEIMTKEEVKALVKQLKNSDDENAQITFDEFYAWWEGKSHTPSAGQEKSAFLKMKLQSKSYSQVIKNQYNASATGPKTTKKTDVKDDGSVNIALTLTVGDFKKATETINLTSDLTGASFLDATGFKETCGAKLLIKLSPTATDAQIQDLLGCFKVIDAVIQSEYRYGKKIKKKKNGEKMLSDTLSLSGSLEEINGEKFIAIAVNIGLAKFLLQGLSLHLEEGLKSLKISLQHDRLTLATRVVLSMSVSAEGLEMISIIAGAREKEEELKPFLDAAKLVKTLEWEVTTKTWYEALEQLVGWEAPNPGGVPDQSSESSGSSVDSDEDWGPKSESDEEEYTSWKSVQFQNIDYSSARSIQSKIDKAKDKVVPRIMDDAFFVATGKLSFDAYLNRWATELYKIAHASVTKEYLKKTEEVKGPGIFYGFTGGRHPIDFGHSLITILSEVHSLSFAVGTLFANLHVDVPNLLDRCVNVKQMVYEDIVQETRKVLAPLRKKEAGDHTLSIGGKQHKFPKALLAVRTPHLLKQSELALTEQESVLFLDYFYGDVIPQDFPSLLLAGRAARKAAWKDMELAVRRAIFGSITQKNVYERLIQTDGCDHEDLEVVNWLIHYAVTSKVPYYKKPIKKVRKQIKQGLATAAPSEEEVVNKLKDCHLHARIESEKTTLSLPQPVIPSPPKSNLFSSLALLSTGQHSDTQVTVDSTVFPVHKFVMNLRWPQFDDIVKNNSFVDVPADSFQKYVYYFYTGRSDGFTLFDYSYVVGHQDIFPKYLIAHCSQRCLEITRPQNDDMPSTILSGDRDFEIIAASTGNLVLQTLINRRDLKKARYHIQQFAVFQATADSDRRRANHELFNNKRKIL